LSPFDGPRHHDNNEETKKRLNTVAQSDAGALAHVEVGANRLARALGLKASQLVAEADHEHDHDHEHEPK